MNQCIFEQISDKLYRCKNCSYETSFSNLERNCIKLYNSEEGPSSLQRIINFSKAATQHELNGRPKVNQEILEERLKICQNCPSQLFRVLENKTGGICIHESCGCSIKDELTYFNKIAWADQKCPMSHWVESSGNRI